MVYKIKTNFSWCENVIFRAIALDTFRSGNLLTDGSQDLHVSTNCSSNTVSCTQQLRFPQEISTLTHELRLRCCFGSIRLRVTMGDPYGIAHRLT